MLSMLLIESSPPLVRRPLVVVVGSGKRDGEVPGNGAVGWGRSDCADRFFDPTLSSGAVFLQEEESPLVQLWDACPTSESTLHWGTSVAWYLQEFCESHR